MKNARSSNSADQRDDEELSKALAVLISVTRSKKRVLSLTEIATWLEIAVRKLGSYQAVAERVGLSAKMLRQFSYVRRLSKPVQALFERRRLDSVDAATHLAMLPPQEQRVVAAALEAGRVNTIDTRAIVDLRKGGKKGSIEALLNRVRESKVKKEYVAEFVVRGSLNHSGLLKIFLKYLPASAIVRLELDGVIGRLVLTETGKVALSQAAKRLSVPLRRVISTILQREGKS